MSPGTVSIASVVVVCLLALRSIDGREYCLTESFHARCRRWNDVILMDHAHFGRMELGRCVTRNFGHIGCSSDVINQLDVACSGRPSCDLSVSDPSLVRTRPCPKDFTSYLDAVYHCVPAILPSRDECYEAGKQYITTDSGYITNLWPRQQTSGAAVAVAPGYSTSSSTTSETMAAAALPVPADDFTPCPMEFRLLPGQRINFTLYDFRVRNFTNTLDGGGQADYYDDGRTKPPCHRYAIIDEPSVGSIATICGGGASPGSGTIARREGHVYTSVSNVVLLQLIQTSSNARFMIRFEVIGCADPTWLPPEVHVRQVQADRLIVFCNHSVDTYVLVCRDHRWVGEVKNCSTAAPVIIPKPATATSLDATSERTTYSDFLGLPHVGVSVAIILGVAMVTVVYVAVVMVCVLHIRRWRKSSSTRSESSYRRTKTDVMTSSASPAPSFNLSHDGGATGSVYSERTPLSHVCEKVLKPHLYSEFFELRPRPMLPNNLEPTYQTARLVADGRPMRCVRSGSFGSGDVITDAVLSGARCRCSDTYSTGGTWKQRSRDLMTSLIDQNAGAGIDEPAVATGNGGTISPDVVPDGDSSTVFCDN